MVTQPIQDPNRDPVSYSIQLAKINKHFGAVKANVDVDLNVVKGEIHAIVGENGAGKSTLMSILYGFYEADSGSIYVDGKVVSITDSKRAIELGIGMVHQHFMLVDNFTVLENIVLGAEGSWSLTHSLAKARKKLQEISDRYGLNVDLDAVVSHLPVGLQQRVEILKALYRDAKILILDEPTGVLTPQEVDQLFAILKTLKSQGVSILLITHKLQEVIAISDQVSVMRAGAMVATVNTAETTREALAELMVGRKVLLRVDKQEANSGAALLKVDSLTWHDDANVPRLEDVSFTVSAGEIVGVAGVSGNGQTELLGLLSGMLDVQQGQINIEGVCIDAQHQMTPKQIRHLGVGHVAEDRHRDGMVGAFSAEETAIMGFQDEPEFNGSILQNRSAITEHCQELMSTFDVRPVDPNLKSASFSGGNQQKLCIAREMNAAPKVLLVGQPTRGVDIGAIEFIHQQIVALRDQGSAVLVVSVELEEILSLCDRVLVMSEGRIVGNVLASETDARSLGLMMSSSRSGDQMDQQGGQS
ncbi:Ribose import ATP-binding protein RbsA [Marinobacterium sp. xm-v-242]|nr:Ribose import ATP-binding protein RbsA [Marinobacterium sp. xm-v-242]NRP78135.1 Ribose import ATP-binding protein RbsA [Marinobacterium sp. xm-m-383]